MAVPLEQFVRQIEESGILAGGTLAEFLPPQAAPKDAEDLARELIRHKKLTVYQAEAVYRGLGKSLTLGNYVLLERIGAGGMGQVFKAEHRRMHRVVAIKLLPGSMTKDQAAIARFEREVTAAARLRHPNIVAADDADCANGIHFLVMECVDGSDLSVLVRKNGPFPVAKAVNCILQAARGLEYAHAEGVVHRDIKPGNLLLDRKGTVKILDMGLARIDAGGEVSTQAELTGTGTVMGTVDYMAPEQALSTKHADARADIYSLGCSLYYLLTGRATYGGDTLMAKLLAHRDEPIPELRQNCREATPELEAVFRKMVAKKIQDRYQSMSEVITDLERLGFGQKPSAGSQASMTSHLDSSAFSFLKDVQFTPPMQPTQALTKTTVGGKGAGKKQGGLPAWKKPPVLIGAAVIGILLLAGMIVSLPTSGGRMTNTAKLKPLSDGAASRTTKPDPVAGENKPLAFQMPGFDKWVKEVAALPVEQQLETVSNKLIELNPGFDGKFVEDHYRMREGVVWRLAFCTDKVVDISPLRAFSGLGDLTCTGSWPYDGQLSDLSPLSGMHALTELTCACNPGLSDLAPLRDLTLTTLRCDITGVSDLSPLQGMKLQTLSIRTTKVADLSAIHALPLNYLDCSETQVSDLSPLAGMKLRFFWSYNTSIADLAPLKGMPLETLNVGGTHVTDLTILQGMPLAFLHLGETKVSDLSVLQRVPLKEIGFIFKPEAHDVDALRSIKTLETINGKPAADFLREFELKQTELQ